MNKLSYELALELKNNGFPQELCFNSEWYTGTSLVTRNPLPNEKHPSREGLIKKPTLEELIEECGEDFGQLFYNKQWKDISPEKTWCACPYPGVQLPDSEGKTPREAVALLYLALNKK